MRVALDFGSAMLRIASEKQGVILREASLIADGLAGGPAFVTGSKALAMLYRIPKHMQVIAPVTRGAVSAPLAAGMLLKDLIPKALGWRARFNPEVVIAVPTRITDSQELALRRALKFAGLSSVAMVAKPVAAALGAAERTRSQQATMVIDMGAETTEVAALAPGIVVCESLPIGGTYFDQAILCHLRDRYGLEIDDGQAERLKKEIGSAHKSFDEITATVHGRELDSGLPHSLVVSGGELRQAMRFALDSICGLVKRTLDLVPAGLSQDVLARGLVLTGDGAKLKGLALFLSEQIELEVNLSDNPGDCAVLGLLKTLPKKEIKEDS